MPSQKIEASQKQSRLLQDVMSKELDKKNKLYKLKEVINWESLEQKILPLVKIKTLGRERKSPRVMLGLSMLQAMYNYSDNQSSAAFSENMYWQYFCGYEYYDSEIISAATIRRFRKILGEAGYNIILEELIESGIKTGILKKKDLESVIVDTTVQLKNIKHPHDVHLMEKARVEMVSLCHRLGIKLNDSYAKKFKYHMIKIWKYRSDSKAKQKHKLIKHLKTLLGRLIRSSCRKMSKSGIKLDKQSKDILAKIHRIHAQSVLTKVEKKAYKDAGNRVLYSFHAEEVECIGKGKLHKPYEFGNKVGISVSANNNFILSAKSFRHNPYDGHTLAQTIEKTEQNSKTTVRKVFADLGYRGNNYSSKGKIYTPYSKKKRSNFDKKMQKRRSSIEPVIGHLKEYGRMGRNFLKGVIGDIINPIISSIGFNMRKLANKLTQHTSLPS